MAMEPPTRMDADAVRDEKIKVLRALKPIDVQQRGPVGGARAIPLRGRRARARWRAIPRTSTTPQSLTETFVALKVEIENWRWAGVPFYLRTGKRLPVRESEIVLTFRKIPHSIFSRAVGAIECNRLVLRIQPDEGVKLWLMIKDPGPGGMRLRYVPLDMSFAEAFGVRSPQRLRAADPRRHPRRPDAVHAPRRGRSGVGVDRPDHRRLGDDRRGAEALPGRHLGADRRHLADRARRPHLARRRSRSRCCGRWWGRWPRSGR